MKTWAALVLIAVLVVPANAQESRPPLSVVELETKLDRAMHDLKTLSGTIESLRSELDSLKQATPLPSYSADSEPSSESRQAVPEPSQKDADELAGRIIGPDLGQNEHDHTLGAMPEIFLQSRYSVAPIKDSEAAFDPNFRISRAELR